jgi:hypothetical protein
MLERWASSRSTQRETVPEPRTKWDESKDHDEPLISKPTEKRLRAINRAPEIVGKRFGIEYQTAAQAVRVCKAIGSCRRLQQLSFYHHKEVAGRDDKEESIVGVSIDTPTFLPLQAVIRLRRLRSTSTNDGI